MKRKGKCVGHIGPTRLAAALSGSVGTGGSSYPSTRGQGTRNNTSSTMFDENAPMYLKMNYRMLRSSNSTSDATSTGFGASYNNYFGANLDVSSSSPLQPTEDSSRGGGLGPKLRLPSDHVHMDMNPLTENENEKGDDAQGFYLHLGGADAGSEREHSP